ncbi:MAG: IclR family transcriptional regulator, partial [Bacillota bacterium]|nr:IclR family transcriptional regulator [Bacillota bacterium]
MTDKSSFTRSIERALDILECFLPEVQELSLMDISNKTELSPSTVHRLIATLESRHYLKRNEATKKYYLGSTIAQLGNTSLSNLKKDFRTVALPYMSRLSTRFNETVSMFVVEGKTRMCVERVETTHALRRVLNIGERLPLDRGATGRLLLAYLPKEQVEEIMDEYSESIEQKLQEIRDNGYAFSIGEREEGLAAIAAPVFYAKGKVIAGLAMSGPTVRFVTSDMSEKISAVMECAAEIS